jgi:UDP-glucose 4-epimerase
MVGIPRGKVLVLGANGFAGAAIVAGLARSGRLVCAYGRAHVTTTNPNIESIQGSIEDGSLLRDAVAECSDIVHAASLTTPGTSARDPALEVIGNLLPLARLLECANEFRQRRLIYLSSGGTVYGDLAADAVETTPLRPRSYYGAGKVAAEALIHACTEISDWRASVLRPSNLYGPGQETARGFAIVPTLFERARDGQPFQIWGDGLAVRDYCYIDDLVDAVRLALERPMSQRFALYNVASGSTASVVELIAACERVSGRPIATEFKPARQVDVLHVSPNSAAIRSALDWKPQIDLAEGLARSWRWIEHNRSEAASR